MADYKLLDFSGDEINQILSNSVTEKVVEITLSSGWTVHNTNGASGYTKDYLYKDIGDIGSINNIDSIMNDNNTNIIVDIKIESYSSSDAENLLEKYSKIFKIETAYSSGASSKNILRFWASENIDSNLKIILKISYKKSLEYSSQGGTSNG